MHYYQEITLIPNSDIERNFLWSKTCQQLHLGLVEIQNRNRQVPIGLSFPEYRMDGKFGVLGGKCRLFAPDEATLVIFKAQKWLERLSDYVHCTGIRPVPEKPKAYAVYQRRQPITGKERLARRYAKRHGQSYEQALQRYETMPAITITFPYIRLKSLSSGREFCLWIKKMETPEPAAGYFSTYGLSKQITVPEF